VSARLAALLLVAGCASAPQPRVASSWPEADVLFTQDPHWVGADDAYSVDLGHGRVLWLFADTLIDPSGRHARPGAVMIRNSVAIQDGYDPAQARIAFAWGRSGTGAADSFFAAEGDDWLARSAMLAPAHAGAGTKDLATSGGPTPEVLARRRRTHR